MNKDMSKEWDYRVVRQTSEDGNEWLAIKEVYYDDETGEPMAHTIDLQIEADSVTELRKQLQRMLWCIDKEIVDEIESEVAKDNIENRMLSLEMENAEMRDRLDELGEQIKSTPNNMELGEKVRRFDTAQGESEDIQNTIKEAVDKERGL